MKADDSLDMLLKQALPPEDLQALEDAELETRLEMISASSVEPAQALDHYLSALHAAKAGRLPAKSTDHAFRHPGRRLAFAAAFAVLALGAALIWRTLLPPAIESPDPVTGKPASEKVTIEVTEPEYVGTPGVPAVPPAAEDPLAARHSFEAPAGTVLISRGKPVRASAQPLNGDLRMLTDGQWATEGGGYLELAPGLQWVEIDLGVARELWGLVIWHLYEDRRVYDDVVVQLSRDPGFTANVTTVFNNDTDDSSGLGKGRDPAWEESTHGRIIEIDGSRARYVRLHSAGNSVDPFNHYVEVEIYGK